MWRTGGIEIDHAGFDDGVDDDRSVLGHPRCADGFLGQKILERRWQPADTGPGAVRRGLQLPELHGLPTAASAVRHRLCGVCQRHLRQHCQPAPLLPHPSHHRLAVCAAGVHCRGLCAAAGSGPGCGAHAHGLRHADPAQPVDGAAAAAPLPPYGARGMGVHGRRGAAHRRPGAAHVLAPAVADRAASFQHPQQLFVAAVLCRAVHRPAPQGHRLSDDGPGAGRPAAAALCQ